jgi:hypothetical protein
VCGLGSISHVSTIFQHDVQLLDSFVYLALVGCFTGY